ncbi:MAG TPA: hypothetical protein VHR45_00590 [Thermoanaerobaculia bacterium]|nr:hypothetical protein [Thermoanaerobaculia bacterium]
MRTVALSQAWAYGHRLLLGNRVAVLDLETPPRAAELRSVAAAADRIGLYAADLERSAAAARLLGEAGFDAPAVFHFWQSKPVLLFRKHGGGR